MYTQFRWSLWPCLLFQSCSSREPPTTQIWLLLPLRTTLQSPKVLPSGKSVTFVYEPQGFPYLYPDCTLILTLCVLGAGWATAYFCWRRSLRGCDHQLTHKLDAGNWRLFTAPPNPPALSLECMFCPSFPV